MRKGTKKRGLRPKNAAPERLLLTAAKSAAVGLGVSVILLLAVAGGIVSGAIAQDMGDEFVICCVLIGSALAGFICAKKRGGGVVTAGITASAIYLLVILFGSIFTAGEAENGTIILKIIIASASGGAFGGVLCLYKKTKKSKLRKKI